MKTSQLQVGQYRINYLETGQGYPLVFLHGFLASSLAWNDLISYLSDQFRCISIDLLGFGDSSKPDIPLSIDMQVVMLRAVIASLDLQDYSLVGHSMGGWIATAYALQYPSSAPQRLFLLAPAGIRDEQQTLRYLLYAPLVLPGPLLNVPLALSAPFIEAAGFQKELQQLAKIRRFFRERPLTPAQLFEGLLRNRMKPETIDHQLHRLQVPTLIVMGAKDGVIPYAHAQTYAEKIPAAELLCFDDARHDLHISHAPLIADRLIRLFQSTGFDVMG